MPQRISPSPADVIRSLWNNVLFPSAAEPSERIRFGPLAVLLILPALLLYPTLGFHLLEPDESRYAQIPKEMLVRGDWVVPTLQGEPYLDKPPLMYWLVMASYSMLGVTESAARLVPALCVHLTILAVYLLGRRSIGERAAFWAAVLLAVTPGYSAVARLLLLDGLLTLAVTLSVLCGYEAVRTGRLIQGWWIASALFSGIGFLTKGPISELLLFPPLVAIAWLTGRMAHVGGKNVALFAAIVAAVNLPWYVAIYLREPAFLKYFFVDHNLMRFLQPFDHLQPVWYYAPIFLAGFLPGSLLLIPYLRSLWRGDGSARTAHGGFWLLAGAWCLAFFSVSGSKLPTYILPAYPFCCLAIAEFAVRGGWLARPACRAAVPAFAAILATVFHAGLPWYARERSPIGRPELVERFLDDEKLVTYPRNCDSLAFYSNRHDLERVRSKDVNELIVSMHHRPSTVIFFTHRSSWPAFRQALPPSLQVIETVNLRRGDADWLGKLIGDTPWGLVDIAVIAPAGTARAAAD